MNLSLLDLYFFLSVGLYEVVPIFVEKNKIRGSEEALHI